MPHPTSSLCSVLVGFNLFGLLAGCASSTALRAEESAAAAPHHSPADTPFERQQSPYPDLVRPSDDLALSIYEERSATDVGAATTLATATLLRLHVEDCRIREAEPVTAARDLEESCKAFNQQTFDGRRQRVLRVPSGRTRVLVYNTGSQPETGIWIRKMHEDSPVTVASTGGISAESPQMLDLDLEPGHYLYSSPVNPTPDYLLIVEP